jgi:hypothetical protein
VEIRNKEGVIDAAVRAAGLSPTLSRRQLAPLQRNALTRKQFGDILVDGKLVSTGHPQLVTRSHEVVTRYPPEELCGKEVGSPLRSYGDLVAFGLFYRLS